MDEGLITITGTLNEDGTVTIDINGVQDDSCHAKADEILRLLNGELETRTTKPRLDQFHVLNMVNE